MSLWGTPISMTVLGGILVHSQYYLRIRSFLLGGTSIDLSLSLVDIED